MFALAAMVLFLVVLILHIAAGTATDVALFDLGMVFVAAALAFGPVIPMPWHRTP